jgi:hypothetical protein
MDSVAATVKAIGLRAQGALGKVVGKVVAKVQQPKLPGGEAPTRQERRSEE